MDQPVCVYSTPFCAPCEQLKRYLTARHIPFVTRDLMMDEDANEFIEAQGIRTSPVLQIGDVLVHGNDLEPGQIDRLLGLDPADS